MDSTMYFFAGSEVCLKVIPVFAVMSSSWGIGRLLHLVDLAPGGGGEGVGWPPWANAKFAERPRRSEEHTSELQSRGHLVCRLLLEKKKPTSAYAKPAAFPSTFPPLYHDLRLFVYL